MALQSIWAGTARSGFSFPKLLQAVEVDVAIIGGGITGVTLAALLAERGQTVALLEAREIGLGSTGNSTGNLYETLSSGLHEVVQKWGADGARIVVESRRAAIAHIEARARVLGDVCAFRRCPVVRYAVDSSADQTLEQERAALASAGVDTDIVEDAEVPIGRRRALRLPDQAQFHPLAYVRALAKYAADKGARIYEYSPALSIGDDAHTIDSAGTRLRARAIAMATHTPKGIYAAHAEMIPKREYGVAIRVDPRRLLVPGAFWGHGQCTSSVRSLEYDGSKFIVVVGEEGKVGLHNASASAARLEQFARTHFGEEIVYRWSAQNYQPPDGLPLIGASFGSDIEIATGFATDGLTYGTLAALIIADNFTGGANAWSDLYRANRVTPVKSAPSFLEEQKTFASAFVRDRLHADKVVELAEIGRGMARVVKVNGELVAAYRDDSGTLTAVSAKCTHMGCVVHWNHSERTWDCPCHGSRFDRHGEVIEGPALRSLEQKHEPGPTP